MTAKNEPKPPPIEFIGKFKSRTSHNRSITQQKISQKNEQNKLNIKTINLYRE